AEERAKAAQAKADELTKQLAQSAPKPADGAKPSAEVDKKTAAPSGLDWKTYRSKAGDYSIAVPKDTEVKEMSAGFIHVLIKVQDGQKERVGILPVNVHKVTRGKDDPQDDYQFLDKLLDQEVSSKKKLRITVKGREQDAFKKVTLVEKGKIAQGKYKG